MQTRSTLSSALKDRKSLICFVTAGDPPLDQLPAIIDALTEGGTDVIEVGIPFSDPIADGPTIQASSQRALDRGVTTRDIFNTLSSVRSTVPLVAMGYTNTAMRLGYERFAECAAAAGISGVILSDLAPDDSFEWRKAAAAQGIDTIFLAAPTSTDARLQAIAAASTGFVYCVSRTGVTGAGSSSRPEITQTVERIRRHTHLPICVGFGIAEPEHVRMVWENADGAVIGSAIVDFLQRHWKNGDGRQALVSMIKRLKEA
jgi:tryptophan synthase alpha chain